MQDRAAPRGPLFIVCVPLAEEFGVSAERIRQIESAALKKMKGALAAFV